MRCLPLFLACLLFLPTAAASWLQDGGDAGGTGRLDGLGPEWPDVALAIPAPEGLLWSNIGSPLIVDDTLLVATYSANPLEPRAPALFKVSLATGVPERWVNATEPRAIALGNATVVIAEIVPASTATEIGVESRLRAFDWETGVELWAEFVRAPPPDEAPSPLHGAVDDSLDQLPFGVSSIRLVVDSTDLYVAYAGGGFAANALFVEKRDLASGEVAWMWNPETEVPSGSRLPAAAGEGSLGGSTAFLTVSPKAVYPVLWNQFTGGWDAWQLDKATGAFVGQDIMGMTTANRTGHNSNWYAAGDSSTDVASRVIADGSMLLQKVNLGGNLFVSYGPEDGLGFSTAWSTSGQDLGTPSALGPAVGVYATRDHVRALYSGRVGGWEYAVPPGLSVARLPILIDDERVYVPVVSDATYPENLNGLIAIDLLTGDAVWSAPATGSLNTANFLVGGNGVLLSSSTRNLTVFGTIEASPTLAAHVSTRYPPPGSRVRVDMRPTDLGLGSAFVSYRAVWGDGITDEWGHEPRLTHRYGSVGDYHARFEVLNDVGQTSSVPITFYVGAPDPSETFLEKAFNSENQNTTFFILGLGATVVFALAGVAKVARRRSRLRLEIRDLEKEFEATRGNPSQCEIMLNERRARSQKLALDARLDEGQSAILLQRVVDLRHKLRIGQMDRRLNFLPYGVVQALQEHLRDGTLSLWERDHLVKVLDDDKILSAKQKGEVRGIIDGWFEKDAGAKA